MDCERIDIVIISQILMLRKETTEVDQENILLSYLEGPDS